ncbi:hypothetical protein Tco_1289386, partial [Tanacetum coccineum]
VMAIFVVLISLDSSEEIVGTSTARVILFGTIPTVIPAIVPIVDPPVVHDETPLIPIETLTIPPIFSTLPHTSLFLVVACSSPPSSPTHDSSPTDVTLPTLHQILPVPPGLPRRPAILVLPSQPILFGRPYRTQPNGARKMLTMRKRVRVLPSGRLASRYLPNHSSSDHFSSDDSSSNSSSDSSSDYSSDSSSGHSLLDSSVDAPATIFSRPSRKRCISPVVLVPLATPVPGALSHVCADLLPPRKRIRGAVTVDMDVDTMAAAAREADVGVEVGIGGDEEDESEEEAESEDKGTIEIRVDRVSKPVVSDKVYESASDDMSKSADERGLDALVQELHDHLVEIPDWGVGERQHETARHVVCRERERVNSLRRHMSYTQEELRQIRVSRYYDRAEFRRLKTFAMRHLGYRP